ncbi:S1 RNA-binding domain-containing protein [Spongiactinospora sp. 9N601]|uniref:S1 RNA-binding domain-containing protein n=1 Tax=Spongiactinospora sp. 9N601 TaxID=3375149 RepID=UPI0037A1B468
MINPSTRGFFTSPGERRIRDHPVISRPHSKDEKGSVYPGVGFITVPELSWQYFDEVSEVVEIGQRVTCSVLCCDTAQGEARISLRALQPDPFQEFADAAREGHEFCGTVTKLVPFGAFVRIMEGIEGLVPLDELVSMPVETPEQVVQIGDRVKVTIISLDRDARRLLLALMTSGRRTAGSGTDASAPTSPKT